MKKYYKVGLVLFVFCLGVHSVLATTRKVLFIGNSYTYTNNMPLMLQQLSASLGDTLIYDESDPGGYTLAQHSAYAPTIAKIFSQQWDIVVLQEQSELPSFPPAEVDTEVYPYAHKLDSMIHANDSCTQTMFLMTWGHGNGDPLNCASYPAICTYDGMQIRLRESYMQMTQDNHAIVAPVGVAWKIVMDSIPSIWLYISDSSHPLPTGSYLESCVLYSSIFHKPSFGSAYKDSITTSVANTLQQLADRVVFDSISQWQQYGHYPYAGITYTTAGNSAGIVNSGTIPTENSWSFGDGTTDTGSSFFHTYPGPGNYVVSHTVTTTCFTETLTETIHLGTAGFGSAVKFNTYPILLSQDGNGRVTLAMPVPAVYDVLEVYDNAGRCIRKYTTSGNPITDNFRQGMYVIRAWSADRSVVFCGKLAVY